MILLKIDNGYQRKFYTKFVFKIYKIQKLDDDDDDTAAITPARKKVSYNYAQFL